MCKNKRYLENFIEKWYLKNFIKKWYLEKDEEEWGAVVIGGRN